MTRRARIAFEVACDAFVRLEIAHQEGRRGVEESATFRAKVALFREAAKAVHRAAVAARESAMRLHESDGPTSA
jgi:hypothetical protein